jgi:Tfp pilus assembly protein PilO
MENIITAVIVSTIFTMGGAFVLLKVLETKMEAMGKEVDELRSSDSKQKEQITSLETSYKLTTSHIQDYIAESKAESKAVRQALTENTIAISSLENFLKRIENKLN